MEKREQWFLIKYERLNFAFYGDDAEFYSLKLLWNFLSKVFA